MKLTILKEKLKEGVNIVEKITQKSTTLPILQTILFETEKNFLKLSTTNLETGISWWNLSKIESEGKICLPTKIFSQLINFLPPKPLSLSKKDLSLFIECDNRKTKILGLNPEDFPILPQVQKENQISIESNLFCDSLSQVNKIPSPSLARPEISGIFLDFQGNLVKLVATDSFRLAEKRIFLSNSLSQRFSLILPQDSARELINIFGEKEGELKIYFSPKQIWFETLMPTISHPEIQYTSRLIEGEYPNYEEIIPKKFETIISLPKDEFLNQIKTASLFSGKGNEVKLIVDPEKGKIIISSKSPNLGDYESSLGAEIKGKKIEITFNYRFLIEGILEIKSKELIFEITNEEGPALLRPVDLEDYFYILMPIKLS